MKALFISMLACSCTVNGFYSEVCEEFYCELSLPVTFSSLLNLI